MDELIGTITINGLKYEVWNRPTHRHSNDPKIGTHWYKYTYRREWGGIGTTWLPISYMNNLFNDPINKGE